MKTKIICLIAFSVVIISCTEHEITYSNHENLSFCKIRSYEEALKIAQSALPMLDNTEKTRGTAPSRTIEVNSKKVFKIDPKTRTSSNINDTLIYVFNFENNEGFVLVSAPKNAEGLLAITESGHCDPDTLSGIEGFDLFIDKAKEYIAGISSLPADTLVNVFQEYQYNHNIVGPYVTVKWGQNYTEGEFCPNGICGCAATAMAQAMSYYSYPSTMSLTYPDADISLQSFNWANIRSHNTKHHYDDCLITEKETHRSTSRLCRQLGHKANSDYRESGTWTSVSSLKNTMENYGYNTIGWSQFNSSTCIGQLDNQHVMIMYGNQNGENGHFWILDGYDIADYYIYTYIQTGNSAPVLDHISGPHIANFNHLNWGWYGVNNGYFNMGVFNTSDVIFPDTPSNYVSYNFNHSLYTLTVYSME